MSKPKLIVIVGPTASGKTALGLRIAKRFGGEVIAADSRTVYRGMDVGTAKPEGERVGIVGSLAVGSDLAAIFAEKPLVVEGVAHWGIDIVDPDAAFTAVDFKAYAEKKIDDIVGRGHVPMLVGGTGLYVSAVVDNLSFTDAGTNMELRAELEVMSDQELLLELHRLDEEAADTIDVKNRRRVMRAIEILRTTGSPLAEQKTKADGRCDALQIGVDIEREALYERINTRVDEMIAKGLVDEVRGLLAKYGGAANAMTGIGYRQIVAFLDGRTSLKEAIETIKSDSRHYAKRQLTWFKRDERICWVTSEAEAVRLVEAFLE